MSAVIEVAATSGRIEVTAGAARVGAYAVRAIMRTGACTTGIAATNASVGVPEIAEGAVTIQAVVVTTNAEVGVAGIAKRQAV